MPVQAPVPDQPFQMKPVPLPFPSHDIGMRLARHQVHHLRMPGNDRGQRFDRGFDTLARRDAARMWTARCGRGVDRPPPSWRAAGTRRIPASSPCGDQRHRRTVRYDAHLRSGSDAGVDNHPTRGVGENRDRRGLPAQFGDDLRLLVGGARQHGVQRDDVRLAQLTRQGEHVGSAFAAENAVFMLDQDGVGAPRIDRRRCGDVVRSHVLTDHVQNLCRRRGSPISNDGDNTDSHRRIRIAKRLQEVPGERRDPAGTRRICGNDRDAHRLSIMRPAEYRVAFHR